MYDPRFHCDGCRRSFHHHPEGMAMLGQCMDCWKKEQMQDLWAEFAKEQELDALAPKRERTQEDELSVAKRRRLSF